MGNSDKRPPLRVYGALALVGEIGLAVAIPIVVGVVLGQYLDRRWNTHGLVLTGLILLGIVCGAYNAYRIFGRIMGSKD